MKMKMMHENREKEKKTGANEYEKPSYFSILLL